MVSSVWFDLQTKTSGWGGEGLEGIKFCLSLHKCPRCVLMSRQTRTNQCWMREKYSEYKTQNITVAHLIYLAQHLKQNIHNLVHLKCMCPVTSMKICHLTFLVRPAAASQFLHKKLINLVFIVTEALRVKR